jgi:hypothetical protein
MKKLYICATMCAGLIAGTMIMAGPSSANEINHRLHHQNKRIDKGMRKGQLSGAEASQLHAEDQSIHNQEHQDRMEHNGHLTHAEKHQINHEENMESHQIKEDRHN